MRNILLELPRPYKRVLQVAVDVGLVWGALWLAFLARLGLDDMANIPSTHRWLFLYAPVIAIPIFIRFGMYRAVMRYFGTESLITIVKAVTLVSCVTGIAIYWHNDHEAIVPRSIIFNYWWISVVMLGGARLVLRQYFWREWAPSNYIPFKSRSEEGLRVAIYGAGSAGNQLVAALRLGRDMRPVAFIDDDHELTNRVISGLQVYNPKNIKKMLAIHHATEILLAIPSASRGRRREILSFLEQFPIHVRTVPGFMDLASGRVKVDDIQEVGVADLLGRDSVPPQADLLERCITNKCVLVTGAGGSIGSELCRQIIVLKPKLLLLFDHSEFNLYSITHELDGRVERESLLTKVVAVLGSVRNLAQLQDLMAAWKVDSVYHAAAYKHVPMVEHNIAEGIINNVMGTLNAAQAALICGVANFVLISTDKAVRPTNIMGSTKRLAEMVLQALSGESAPKLFGEKGNVCQVNKTRFTMVRFGNVLGSSGSVIPLFHRQIKSGGPITVTHPNITRYFMTIPEAAQLVIQAGSMGRGGDVFVLDMGEPVKITDLAEKMIHLSGLSIRDENNARGDIEIVFTGLRPGEKLYEELLIGDNVTVTEHPMIMTAEEDFLPWENLKARLAELLQAASDNDYVHVRQIIRETVAGYAPEGEIVDWIHQRRNHEK